MDFSAYDLVDVPVFVLVPDQNGRPVYGYMNPVSLGRIGKTLDEIRGKAAFDLFEGRAAYAVFRRQMVAWQSGAPVQHEISLPVGGGSIWIRTTLAPVRDAGGTMTHIVGTVVDINAERELEQQQAMTVADMREVEDLVCLAAHDLRSPIGNLKSLSNLLREDFVDHGDGKLELINLIDGIADQALAVISDVMARVIGRSAAPASIRFDFGAVCDDIVMLLDPLRTHSVSYPRIDIETDRVTVQIVLRNLIDNAFKYASSPTARVSIVVEEINAQRLAIEVRDTGSGRPVHAAHQMTDQTQGGYGLQGVDRLVKARGGEVFVDTPEDGSGAVARIELPGRIPAQAAEQADTA